MENVTKILSVAVGGALGALLRYFINASPLQTAFSRFPFHTFFINITGSFLIGFLMVFLTEKFPENENLRLALVVGFLGAYTTFSTFEFEIFKLIEEKDFVTAVSYLFFSILIGFTGVITGVWLAKKI